MKQLVELEMKKVRMNSIIKLGMATCGVVFVYMLVFGVILRQMPSDSIQFFNKVIAYNKFAYTVFFAILIHKMFSEEIYSKSLSISFTYPISRIKLLTAKIVLIVCIGLPFMFASTLVHFILLGLCNMIFHLTQTSVGVDIFIGLVISGLLQCLLGTLAAFIPLYADVKFASTQVTIVASVVLSLFLYSCVGSNLYGIEWFFYIIAAIVGGVLTKVSLEYVVEKDIM